MSCESETRWMAKSTEDQNTVSIVDYVKKQNSILLIIFDFFFFLMIFFNCKFILQTQACQSAVSSEVMWWQGEKPKQNTEWYCGLL